MKPSMEAKLEALCERHQELSALLSSPDVINKQDTFRAYSKEYSDLEPVVNNFTTYQNALMDLATADQMLKESDSEMRAFAEEEITEIKNSIGAIEEQLQILLLPTDPNDEKDIFLEVRAGTGGDEAAIFVGDLSRMYLKYAEGQGWRTEVMTSSPAEHGGFKEIIIKISGVRVYSFLKFESGAHRVQRVPTTESQGRIHTSACTVAILPEVTEIDEFVIDPSDLKVDTYRASGAGGQHVNKTDSAVRLTHLPTGVVVECQDERSQHKNRARAMSLLQSRLLVAEQTKQQEEQALARKSLVGSGDRSERIRTYNYPQGRVTDHRINLTLYKLDEVMNGDLGQVVNPLTLEHQADLLASLND